MFRRFDKVLFGILLIGGTVNGNCTEPGEIMPFLTNSDVSKCVRTLEEHKGTDVDPIEIVRQRIEVTKRLLCS